MAWATIFLIVALVLAGIATVGVPTNRFNAVAGALFFYFLSLLVGGGALSG